jgi:hypothetical protein
VYIYLKGFIQWQKVCQSLLEVIDKGLRKKGPEYIVRKNLPEIKIQNITKNLITDKENKWQQTSKKWFRI